MKKLLKFSIGLLIAVASFAFVSCGDDTTGNGNGGEATLTLKADKTTVKSDGTQSITFTVLLDNEDVTSSAKIFDVTAAEYLADNVFTPEENANGNYPFYAEYDSKQSATVTISVLQPGGEEGFVFVADRDVIFYDGDDVVTFSARFDGIDVMSETAITDKKTGENIGSTFKTTEKKAMTFEAVYKDQSATITLEPAELRHRVTFAKITGTGCGFCYNFTQFIERANIKDYYSEVQIHVNAPSADQFATTESLAYADKYASSGSAPWGAYDFAETTVGAVNSAVFTNIIKKYAESDLLLTVKADSKIDGNLMTVNATVWGLSDVEEIFVGAILMENGLIAYQASYGNGYTHNNVFRTGRGGYYGTSLGTIAKNELKTTSFEFDIPAKYVQENLEVVIFVTIKNEAEKYIAKNSIVCPANGRVGYAHF